MTEESNLLLLIASVSVLVTFGGLGVWIIRTPVEQKTDENYLFYRTMLEHGVELSQALLRIGRDLGQDADMNDVENVHTAFTHWKQMVDGITQGYRELREPAIANAKATLKQKGLL